MDAGGSAAAASSSAPSLSNDLSPRDAKPKAAKVAKAAKGPKVARVSKLLTAADVKRRDSTSKRVDTLNVRFVKDIAHRHPHGRGVAAR